MADRQEGQQAPSSRQFVSTRVTEEFTSNEIKTTTTNVLTFVPVNLFNQLKSMANSTDQFTQSTSLSSLFCRRFLRFQ